MQACRTGSSAPMSSPAANHVRRLLTANVLAEDPAVSPGRVLVRQPQHQVADVRTGAWAPGPVRVGPFACDQATVPGQQRARRDEPAGAQHGWQQPGQCRQDGAVGPVRLGPGDLTAEHRDFVTENYDLGVLGSLAAAQQHQPAKDPDHDQVEQTKEHEPRSCRNQLIGPNTSSQHPQRVLKRYRAAELQEVGQRPACFAGKGARGLQAEVVC